MTGRVRHPGDLTARGEGGEPPREAIALLVRAGRLVFHAQRLARGVAGGG